MSKRVVGIYETAEEAVAAVERLRSRGYNKNDISLAVSDDVRQTIPVDYDGNIETSTTASESHEPSFWEQVKDAFSFEDDVAYDGEKNEADHPLYGYENQIQSGHIAVIVESDEAIDVDKSDYVGADPDGAVTGVGPYDAVQGDVDHDRTEPNLTDERLDRDLTDEETIQLREERLNVDKETVQTGEVRIKKEIVEETETIEVPVTHEEVTIERKPADGQVTGNRSGEILEDDDEIVIPVHEEQVRVDKESVVTEEVDVKRKDVTEDKRVTDTVKREELDIDADGNIDVDQ